MSPKIQQRNRKIRIPSRVWLLIFTFICIFSMAVSYTTDTFVNPMGTVAGFIVTPFQNGIATVGYNISNRLDELGQMRLLLEENKELKAKVSELTIKNTELQQEKYELNTLRQLYELDNEYSDYKKTGARIIGWDGGNWFNSFTINKGSNDGLELDMNVIADGGLVGRISEVGDNWSRVISIIDDNNNVSGMVLSSSDNLMVSGDLELMKQGVIRFQQLMDAKNVVVEGDKVVTSNISDKYLPGLLIGYIGTIEKQPNNLTKSGTLVPAVDFAHLEEILVVLDKKQVTE